MKINAGTPMSNYENELWSILVNYPKKIKNHVSLKNEEKLSPQNDIY